MPLQATSGAASYDAFGGGAAAVPAYIEDVFSTFLYTQNTSSQNIPLQTGVGFTASDEWQSNTLLTTSASSPICAFDSSGNYYLASGDNPNGYIAKFSSTGVKTWQVNILPPTSSATFRSIRVASSGAVYVAGVRSNNVFVCKLTSSGAISWLRELTSTGSLPYMDLDSSENVHFVYHTSSPIDGRYARFDSNGTQDTANSKTFSTGTQTDCRGVTVDSSGNVYICGRYYTGTLYNGYVIKFNSSMTLQWSRALSTATSDTILSSVSVDSSGNVYVAGQYRATNDRPLFAKYDSAGTLQWQKNFFQTGNSFRANAIKVDASGNSYVCGLGPNDRWFIARIDTNGDVAWQKVFRTTRAMNTCEASAIDIDSLGGLLVSGGSNESTSSVTTRSQVLKMGQSGLSNGVTAYGTLATGAINYGNASASSSSPTFTVSSGQTIPTATYTSTANTLSTVYQNIPVSTSTGALLWIKNRTTTGGNIFALSNTSYIQSNTTGAAFAQDYALELVSNGALIKNDVTTDNWASWTFRKQPKFFDVVTYTGTGTIGNLVNHSLGVRPSLLIAKSTSTTEDWAVVYIDPNAASPNRTRTATLNSTAIFRSTDNLVGFSASTFDPLYIGNASTNSGAANTNGVSYVAYLFASNAGGFGLTGTDNVISCGSYTGNGSTTGPVVTLGYEPQWLMVKRALGGTGNWQIIDNMRGMPVGSADATLQANISNAESSVDYVSPTATGFQITSTSSEVNTNASTYIYIAIRRGPMKVPTTGTSVFAPVTYAGNGGTQTINTGKTWPQDLLIGWDRTFGAFNAGVTSNSAPVLDRLRGFYIGSAGNAGPNLATYSTLEEAFATNGIEINQQFNYVVNYTSGNLNASGNNYINWLFRRAPGFFDVVCYTGNSTARTLPHNLGVAPEMMVVKVRNASGYDWMCYHTGLNAGVNPQQWWIKINNNNENFNTGSPWNSTAPTSSVFSLGNDLNTNRGDGTLIGTYVAYLFATCPGVSKVGSFTGTGATQIINCGFTGGARFVLIKAASTTGNWLVWDSARGIVAGNDPYLALNSTAAEVTNTDWVDTAASGFELSNAVGNLANSNGVSYIFLAIA